MFELPPKDSEQRLGWLESHLRDMGFRVWLVPTPDGKGVDQLVVSAGAPLRLVPSKVVSPLERSEVGDVVSPAVCNGDNVIAFPSKL